MTPCLCLFAWIHSSLQSNKRLPLKNSCFTDLTVIFCNQIPVALLISQLQKGNGGHSGLLRFPEVVSLFHEFGHVVRCALLMPFVSFQNLSVA